MYVAYVLNSSLWVVISAKKWKLQNIDRPYLPLNCMPPRFGTAPKLALRPNYQKQIFLGGK
jgi:hypothetical protein